MKSILVFVFLFLFACTSYSQDEVLSKGDSLNRLLKENISDSERVRLLVELHSIWKNKSYLRSLEYAREAIELSEKHMPKKNTYGLKFMLGYTYMEAGDAVRSLEILHQLAGELENVNPGGYSTALAFIAMNYENQGEYKKALEYQIKANRIFESLTITDSITDSRPYLGNPQKMAVYYLKNNQADSALKYANQSFNRLRHIKLVPWNQFFSWHIKTTLGDVYSSIKEYEKAVSFYTDAEQEAKQFNFLVDLLPIYLARAKIYYTQKNIPKALEYAHKCYTLADTLKILPSVQESTALLRTIFGYQHKMDSALFYYEISVAAKDSMFNLDNTRKIDAMEFAEQKRTQELKTLLREKSFERKQFYLLTGVLSSIFVAVFFYNKNRLKQKANQLLRYENKEIFLQRNQLQQQVESYEMQALKAQMNPHFMFNCINSIDSFIQTNDKYNATLYLNKFAKLIRNVLDSSKENTVFFSKDIDTLILYIELEELRSENKFSTQINIDEELISSDYKVPPLIIQPFVENAIIHGLRNTETNNGILQLTISKTNKHIIYSIKDNGIGRKAAEKINTGKDKSYGMQMSFDRIKLFNKEEKASVLITDLYENEKATGTHVQVNLNIV